MNTNVNANYPTLTNGPLVSFANTTAQASQMPHQLSPHSSSSSSSSNSYCSNTVSFNNHSGSAHSSLVEKYRSHRAAPYPSPYQSHSHSHSNNLRNSSNANTHDLAALSVATALQEANSQQQQLNRRTPPSTNFHLTNNSASGKLILQKKFYRKYKLINFICF